MKIQVLFIALFFSSAGLAQPKTSDYKVVIVSCKSGDLYIDGSLIGKIEAEDAHAETLSDGEHYLQVKTTTEKLNTTIKIDGLPKGIIRIGCDDISSSAASSQQSNSAASTKSNAVLLFDKVLDLGGALTKDIQQNVVALDEGDNILLTCAVLNKKGSANISIREYLSNTEIFRNEGFSVIDNRKISIPTKGIYIFNVTTGALFGKDIRLAISRIPSTTSSPNFKTTIRRYWDTTHTEVMTTDAVVHSVLNGAGNKSVFPIKLPANTTYFTYWIGVGQEAKEKMKNFVGKLSSTLAPISADPLVLFGLKLIPALPILNGTSTVSYRFTDAQNAGAFMGSQNFGYFEKLKFADNIASDYATMNATPKEIYLAMWNNNTLVAADVNIRVVAFSVTERFSMQD
jgi:hypothetical protein